MGDFQLPAQGYDMPILLPEDCLQPHRDFSRDWTTSETIPSPVNQLTLHFVLPSIHMDIIFINNNVNPSSDSRQCSDLSRKHLKHSAPNTISTYVRHIDAEVETVDAGGHQDTEQMGGLQPGRKF